MILVDPTGHVLYLNRRSRQLLGLASTPRAGTRVEFILRDPGLVSLWTSSSGESGPVTAELTLFKNLRVRATISPCLSEARRLIGKALLLHDVTQEKKIHVELTDAVARRLLQLADEQQAPDPLAGLTVREREILRLLTEGLSNGGMADRLHLSPHTVASHLKNLYAKLNVTNRAQAVAFSILHGVRPSTGR
ncbi:MAG: LuxR C-terminal-related transcriptional regulator [Acidobacteriota bacterium]